MTELPVWRSMLFVPVTVLKFVERAAERSADAIILDLEDSVPVAEKPRGRELLQEAAATVARKGADVVVRINRPWRMALKDIEAAISPRVQALMVTKAESADHLRMVAEIVAELELERGMTPGATKLVALVETAGAFFRMEEIARAHPRLVGLSVGAEDFALALGMLPEAEGLFYPKQHMIIAARAAGILPLGFLGTVADFRDLDAFRATIRRSRRLGFAGASCIHPSQVPILNEEYRPSPEEVEAAERAVAAYDSAVAAGIGAIELDGKMIDVPVVERAKQVLTRHRAIVAREARR
ncbi:MAG TPA: CoA ester lyase [Stellaceae bacterium]|jgi:citrate lyase subunit beta / citryl-CoA lyase|nr:CoA ester lyase [Stellaceae bacterium]